MQDSYKKFKKKIILEVLIKSIIFGFSIGLICFSVSLIYIKVRGIEFKIIYLILATLLLMLITSGLIFLILKPSEKKIAIRIDNDLNLNEKVQTMIEYKDKDSLMINLQREDTLRILSNTHISKLTLKLGVILIIILASSVLACVTAIAIPTSVNATECINHIDENNDGLCDICNKDLVDDPDYVTDNWTELMIKQLIERVKNATFNDSLKTKYVSLLENLLNDLKTVEKESEMKRIVYELIAAVKLELDKVNTNNEVYSVLKESDTSLIKSLAESINYLNIGNVETYLGNIVVLISGKAAAITELDNSAWQIFRTSKLDKNDELYLAIFEFMTKLNECTSIASNPDEYNDELNEAVKNVIKTYSTNIITALDKQLQNKVVEQDIIKTLEDVFGIEDTDLNNNPNEDPNGDSQDPNGDEDDKKIDETDNQGGLGTGEVIFGSDEAFFDPEKGMTEYGEVITDYYGDIFAKFNEGTLPEELKQYFNKYFDVLFGTEKEEE